MFLRADLRRQDMAIPWSQSPRQSPNLTVTPMTLRAAGLDHRQQGYCLGDLSHRIPGGAPGISNRSRPVTRSRRSSPLCSTRTGRRPRSRAINPGSVPRRVAHDHNSPRLPRTGDGCFRHQVHCLMRREEREPFESNIGDGFKDGCFDPLFQAADGLLVHRSHPS